nr:hypothetical protein [uncultured Deefgea sp.]
MSEIQSATPTQAKKYNLLRNQIHIFGRIEDFKRNEKDYTTTVTLPSTDEFTKPQSVSIQSKTSIGQRGDVVELLCTPCGFYSRFEYSDKKTGEKLTGSKVVGWFELVE